MNSQEDKNNSIVHEIYAGFRHYQIIGSGNSSEGYIIEVSPQESKCWLLDDIKLYSHTALRECLIAGIFCNDSQWQEKQGQRVLVGNPIDKALITAASKAKLDRANLEQLMPKLAVRFQPKSKSLATMHQDIDGKIIYLKASLDEVLSGVEQMLDSRGNLVSLKSELIQIEAESMEKDGLFVLAFAKKRVPTEKKFFRKSDFQRGLIFLGLQGVHCSSLLKN
jgi:cation-transporting ATPase F